MYDNVVKILVKLDMAMFVVKYFKKYTSTFCQICFVFYFHVQNNSSIERKVW